MFEHNSVCMHLEVLLYVVCASGRDYVSQGFCNPGILVPKKWENSSSFTIHIICLSF